MTVRIQERMKKNQSNEPKNLKEKKTKELDPSKMTSQLAKALHKAENRCKLPV